jgi:hypothetical protein
MKFRGKGHFISNKKLTILSVSLYFKIHLSLWCDGPTMEAVEGLLLQVQAEAGVHHHCVPVPPTKNP